MSNKDEKPKADDTAARLGAIEIRISKLEGQAAGGDQLKTRVANLESAAANRHGAISLPRRAITKVAAPVRRGFHRPAPDDTDEPAPVVRERGSSPLPDGVRQR